MDKKLENGKLVESLIFKLMNELTVKDDRDNSQINKILDNLNAIDFRTILDCFIKDAENVLELCFSTLSTSETFLVAKCCNLTLNLVRNKGLTLRDNTLFLFIGWIKNCLKTSADVAFSDILEAMECVISCHSNYFEKNGEAALSILDDAIEERCNLAIPSDVKLLRIKTLHSLALCLSEKYLQKCASIFISIIESQSSNNLLVHAEVLRYAIDGLSGLCTKNEEWAGNIIGDLLGTVLSGAHLGLIPGKPELPSKIYPSTIPPFDLPDPSLKSNHKPDGKRISRNRLKPVAGWSERDELAEDMLLESWSDGITGEWMTSDSEHSDSGDGEKPGKLIKEQAKTRHAALNLLIHLVKGSWSKPFYGYYLHLLGGRGLTYNIQHETKVRPRIAAYTATTALLTRAKILLAQAQYSEGPFTSFSRSLSDLMIGLHSAIAGELSKVLPLSLAAPLLRLTSTLIMVTPYHRLRPSVLTNLFKQIKPYINHRDPTIEFGAVQCLIQIVVISPTTNEHENIIANGASGNNNEDAWLISLCCHNLKEEGRNETCQMAWWQLVVGLSKFHFSKIRLFWKQVEEFLLRDIRSPLKLTQRYAANALESITKQLVGQDDLREIELRLWKALLGGPLIPILQAPTRVAVDGCNCLANMSSHTYSSLNEEVQILIVTLLYGCCHHEEYLVRAAAVRTLGVLLLFSQTFQEQFICDVNSVLVKALSDPVQFVRIKAAWAFGNLADVIQQNQDAEFFQEISIIRLLNVCLSLANDIEKVKLNIVRGVGTLLILVNEEHLKDPQYREIVDKGVTFLIKNSVSGNNMKMRWNACYGLGVVLKNENFYIYPSEWQAGVINGLCGLLLKCNNFKVRINASIALCSITKRKNYKGLYIKVWQSVVDGLENAANMPDFREYQHQDELFNQLCLTFCHLANLLIVEDLGELENILLYRIENLSHLMSRFQASSPPEKASNILTAANNVISLEKNAKLSSQKNSILALREILSLT